MQRILRFVDAQRNITVVMTPSNSETIKQQSRSKNYDRELSRQFDRELIFKMTKAAAQIGIAFLGFALFAIVVGYFFWDVYRITMQ